MRFSSKLLFVVMGLSWGLSVHADESSYYFGTGSATLKNAAAVGKVAKRAADGSAFHVSGYSDPRGSDEVNQRLRNERADAAKRALVAAGVDESRITVEDGGGSTSSDPKTYAKLRRVSITFDGRGKSEAQASATKPTAEERAEQKKAEAEQKKAEAEQKRAEAEQKKAEAAQARTAARSTTEPKTTEPKTTEPVVRNEKKLEPIKLIYWKSLNHALWIVAKQKGFFADEGFDVELTETDEDARKIASKVGVAKGVQTDSALMKGQKKYTMGAVCGFATHEAMAKGDQVVDIGSMVMIPETLLMKKDLAAAIDKDIRAFKDKKIGDSSSGTDVHAFKYNHVLSAQLEKAGLHDDTDFKILEYDDPNKELADLVANKIDVAKVFPPSDIEFTRNHPEFTRVPFAKFFPYLPCCRQLITREQLKNSREKYVRLLRASIRAHEFTIEHPREAAELIGKWLKISPSLVRQSIMSAYVTLTPDPMRKGVELYQRTNDKFVGKKTSTAEFVDTSLYRDALLSLAKENSADPISKGYYDTMISRFRANN